MLFMIGMAFDPGPEKVGVARVSYETTHDQFRLVEGGHLTVDEALSKAEGLYWEDREKDPPNPTHIAAVEVIEGYAYSKPKVADLIKTARVEGRLMQAIERSRGALVMSSGDWRFRLCRERNATDKVVRAIIESLVVNFDSVPSRGRVHVYDAIGLAVVALWSVTGPNSKFVPLPDDVLRAMTKQKLQQRKARR